jgi:hypothetical protein
MIITKIRLKEEHPMMNGTRVYSLPTCDLHVDSSAGQNGYILKAAAGIGPPDFLSIVEGFDVNGVPIIDSVPDKKEIVLRIGFRPSVGQSIQQLRSDLYKYVSRSILLSLMDGSETTAQISCYIQRLEPVHFSKEPELQITLKCNTGYFVAPGSVPIPLATLDTPTPVISYSEGDAPTGIDITFTVLLGEESGFMISNYGKLWYSGNTPVDNQFIVTYPFDIGDVIHINTSPDERKITLTRASVDYDLAGYISAGAVWPKLYPGVNAFDWDISSTWATITEAKYTPRFWGV